MYISTLRQKQGELRALEMLEDSFVDANLFIPNIIVKDATKESLEQIKSKFNSIVLLDTRELEPEEIEQLEEYVLLDEFSDFHINYSVENCINGWPIEKFNYAKIRKSLLNEFFIQWVQQNNTHFPNNIMFDFENVEGPLSASEIDTVTRIIEILGDRNFIICSGAIPNSLPVKADQNYEISRVEKTIFTQIANRVTSNLIFSDYSTVSPLLSAGGRAIVQIKYTLDDVYWFVRNGLRRGNYNFVSVCDEIANNANTFDSLSCWGDQYIQNVVESRQNSGNPSVWASIGINKHIVMCINENI